VASHQEEEEVQDVEDAAEVDSGEMGAVAVEEEEEAVVVEVGKMGLVT
jgi:hypothetical protein